MNRRSFLSFAGALPAGLSAQAGCRKIVTLDSASDLHVWTDTCNVYVLRNGDSAVLVDLGDGSVLERLSEIGVRDVEWVLFTHHHREQCQGYARLKPWSAKIAAPEAERVLFEQPATFRKMRPALSDRFTVHGASFVRPPVTPIPVDRGFSRMDQFEWRGHSFWCLQTKGNSPGSMSYLLRRKDGWLSFSGDVMLDGARMHTWFDSEWDYGFASGLYALLESASLLAAFDPALLLPSHGPEIRAPMRQLEDYQNKLRLLARLAVRGYKISTFAGAEQDRVSRPSQVPHLWQVSPHLFKFKGPDFWPNFYLLLADSGRALVVDCGLLEDAFLDRAIEGLRKRYGLKQIDACIVTHMHGDHMLNAPHLRSKWGARIWALENMVDKCEHPERFDYAALVNTYRKDLEAVPIDRALKPGEVLEWEGYRLTVDWMPGQTEFALCVTGVIDNRRVAFTGDNIFGNAADPEQSGHEALVARNSAILEEGYIRGAELLQRLKPDLILGGHSWVIDRPSAMIERYRKWGDHMRTVLQSVSADEDYRYWFDPYWVHAEPYRVALRPGQSSTVSVHVRNFRNARQRHRVEIHLPPGVTASPTVLDGVLEPGARTAFPVRLTCAADARPGAHIAAFDISLDQRRYGQLFDFLLHVSG